jgi:hypothetical protein
LIEEKKEVRWIMDKLLEGLINLFEDLEKDSGLSEMEALDLLKRVKDKKQTGEDLLILEKISEP